MPFSREVYQQKGLVLGSSLALCGLCDRAHAAAIYMHVMSDQESGTPRHRYRWIGSPEYVYYPEV